MQTHCPVTGTTGSKYAAYSTTRRKDSLTRFRTSHECKKGGGINRAAFICAVKHFFERFFLAILPEGVPLNSSTLSVM